MSLLHSFVALTVLCSTGLAHAAKPAAPEPALPDSLKAELNIEYGKTPEQVLKMDVYRPKTADDHLPACVLVHGGGWLGGDKEKFSVLAIALAQRGYVVANIEYRLGGVAKYPAAVQDCNLAVRFVRANAKRFGLDAKRIGAWGGSAGGHLVGLMAAAPELPSFIVGDPQDVSAKVQSAVVMAGLMDLNSADKIERYHKEKGKSNAFQWIGKLYDEAPDQYKEASPDTYLSAHTPPILFLRGSLDHPEADLASMAKLKEFGVVTDQVVVADGKHGCWMRAPWQIQCLDAVDAFFKRTL